MNGKPIHVADKNSSQGAMQAAIEKISGLTYDGTELSLVVSSNGCTTAADFSIKHEITSNACLVRVVRIKADNCRKAPQPKRIAIAWEKPAACKDLQLMFTNPLLEFQTSPVSR